MTEAEALDLAAKAAGWWDWETLRLIGRPDTRDHIRAHAKTLMENAALKAEIERLREAMKWALEIITDSWGDDQIEQGDDQAANILRAALKENTDG